MTAILLQSALSESRSTHLADIATALYQRCTTTHADKTSHLVTCPDCFPELVDAIRNRYFPPPTIITSSSSDLQPPQQPTQEWFAPRRAFLMELDTMLSGLRTRRVEPAAIDARIREERARWYAENVRSSLLKLMVEDPAGREAVFEKLEDAPADPSSVVAEISQILGESPVISREQGSRLEGVAEKLAAAEGEARVEVLKAVFLEEGEGEERQEKYLEMLQQGKSMEQVVDRILSERQAAVASRDQTEKLKQRLHELKRARAAHEAQKERKQSKRARLVEQVDVPDELYELPPCAACNKVPEMGDFLCCPICAVLVSYKAQEKPVVYCAEHHEPREQLRHAQDHPCAASDDCISPAPAQPPADSTAAYPLRDDSDSLCFCRECLETHKISSMWCSLACAAANFQRHREEVHMPGRIKLDLVVTDRDQLEYLASPDGKPDDMTRYRARDITAHTVSYHDAVKQWEDKSRVKLERAEVSPRSTS